MISAKNDLEEFLRIASQSWESTVEEAEAGVSATVSGWLKKMSAILVAGLFAFSGLLILLALGWVAAFEALWSMPPRQSLLCFGATFLILGAGAAFLIHKRKK